MKVPYLKNRPWSSWTREERFYCAILYGHAARNPRDFASWLIDQARLRASADGEWDLGYEVCFYRDYLWQQPCDSAREMGLPAKRTFDLCVFGERDLIIIEAKVCEPFGAAQNEEFAIDKSLIGTMDGMHDVAVHLVALASSKYFANAEQWGWSDTLKMFDGTITWSDLSKKYPDRLLEQADRMYKIRRGEMLEWPV